MQSFFPEPGQLDAELLMGVEAERVVFGHTHSPVRATGPGGIELVNPGSVGMPWTVTTAPPTRSSTATRGSSAAWSTTGGASVAAVRERVGELPARRIELSRFDVS